MIDDPLNKLKVKRGSALPQSKLSEDDIRLIFQLVADREELKRKAGELTNAKIAEKFGVHLRTIEKAVNGYSWGHVEQNKGLT